MDDMKENLNAPAPEEKKKSSKREIIMIVVVVLLAFGLTVAGIVYLTGFILGEDKNPPKVETPVAPAVPPAEEDNVLRFDMDNTTPADNASAPATEPAPTPAPEPAVTPTPLAPPPVPVATPEPAPVTPPPPAPAAKPTPAKPTAPAKPAIGGRLPTTSPTNGRYQLQFFSSQNEASAHATAMQYVGDCSDMYIMRVTLDNGVWYRARGCSTDSHAQANKMKSEIEKKYKFSPLVVEK